MSDKLREALKKSAQGWANVLELGLLPERHRKTAEALRDEARAALSRAGDNHASPKKAFKDTFSAETVLMESFFPGDNHASDGKESESGPLNWQLSEDAKVRIAEIDANRRNAAINASNIVAGSPSDPTPAQEPRLSDKPKEAETMDAQKFVDDVEKWRVALAQPQNDAGAWPIPDGWQLVPIKVSYLNLEKAKNRFIASTRVLEQVWEWLLERAPKPPPYTAPPERMREALEQRDRDIGILLANVKFLEDCLGESLNEEDASVVRQIEREYNEREAIRAGDDHASDIEAESRQQYSEAIDKLNRATGRHWMPFPALRREGER